MHMVVMGDDDDASTSSAFGVPDMKDCDAAERDEVEEWRGSRRGDSSKPVEVLPYWSWSFCCHLRASGASHSDVASGSSQLISSGDSNGRVLQHDEM
jgi:hypothetical protein